VVPKWTRERNKSKKVVNNMSAEKLLVVVPEEERFEPADLPFGVVTGEGVPDYDNMKSKGKRGGLQYSASVLLTKEENKAFRKTVMDYWEDNKPKTADDKPANWKTITRKGEDSDFILYSKTRTNFGEGKPNVIPIVNHEGVKLDPETYGGFGKGSKGRLAVTLSVYGDDEDAGVSVFLTAVKLTEFSELSSNDGAAAFGSGDKGSVSGEGGFKSEKKDKKNKKDKKKSKK